MTYPGNSSLPAAVKDRVLSTFEQTLTLHRQGRSEEVVSGCNLILQMDPSFLPARQLLEKSRDPSLPIDVDQLLPEESAPGLKQAREAMAAGDYARAIDLASEILSTDLFNEEARVLAEDARQKLESAPPVKETSPSFVVDEQSPTSGSRSAAPASAFGFAFEEDKPAVSFDSFSFDTPSTGTLERKLSGFGFDTPSAPDPAEPAGAGPRRLHTGEFDFATASVEMSSEDQAKIEQYLADGERAFAANDYHQAIDLWSRVFLIDVTNDDASQRIEEAKKKRREIDQQIEPLLTSGIDAFERGDTAAAHDDLTEVLRIDPQNPTAQGYLDRLGEVLPSSAPPTLRGTVPHPAVASSGYEDFPGEEPPPPPPPVAKQEARKPRIVRPVEATPKKLPMRALGVVAALVLLAVAAWVLLPRFGASQVDEAGASEGVLARATLLADAGRFDQAIALLKDIKPNDPHHDKALVMIADLQQKKASAAHVVDGVPSEEFYEERLAAGHAAFAEQDYSRAKMAFEQAMRARPLPPNAREEYEHAAQQTAKLAAAIALFGERKYEDAIANLKPLLEQDPQNQSVRRMIADAHFNLGAVALQQERTRDAVAQFDVVLQVTPGDELARRSRELALRYDNQPKDLLYRIYVRYLPLRKGQ
jgi:tetratricopeptide (TPR) repeat protein